MGTIRKVLRELFHEASIIANKLISSRFCIPKNSLHSVSNYQL